MAFQVRKLVKQVEIKIVSGGGGKREPELQSLLFFATYQFCDSTKSLLWIWFLACKTIVGNELGHL